MSAKQKPRSAAPGAEDRPHTTSRTWAVWTSLKLAMATLESGDTCSIGYPRSVRMLTGSREIAYDVFVAWKVPTSSVVGVWVSTSTAPTAAVSS